MLNTKELILRGWSIPTINKLMEKPDKIIYHNKRNIKLFSKERVEKIENESDDYLGKYVNNILKISIDKQKYKVIFMNHLFQIRKNGKIRIGSLKKTEIKEILRFSLLKSDYLNKENIRFVIIYNRGDDFYTGILVSKEHFDISIISVFHCEEQYKKTGLFPLEKEAVYLNEKEVGNALKVLKPSKKIKKCDLFRKIKKINKDKL